MITLFYPSNENDINEVLDSIIANLEKTKAPSKVHDRLKNLWLAKKQLKAVYKTTKSQCARLDEMEQ